MLIWPEEEGWPQDIGALAILEGRPLFDADGEFRIETVREAVGRRLHLVPRFRQVLYWPKRGLGWPVWCDAQSFDIAETTAVASHHEYCLNTPYAAIAKAMNATNTRTFARVQAVPDGGGVLPAIAGVIHRKVVPNRNRPRATTFLKVHIAPPQVRTPVPASLSARALIPFSIRRSIAKSPNSIRTRLNNASRGVSQR
jgi:hypothetical protein